MIETRQMADLRISSLLRGNAVQSDRADPQLVQNEGALLKPLQSHLSQMQQQACRTRYFL